MDYNIVVEEYAFLATQFLPNYNQPSKYEFKIKTKQISADSTRIKVSVLLIGQKDKHNLESSFANLFVISGPVKKEPLMEIIAHLVKTSLDRAAGYYQMFCSTQKSQQFQGSYFPLYFDLDEIKERVRQTEFLPLA